MSSSRARSSGQAGHFSPEVLRFSCRRACPAARVRKEPDRPPIPRRAGKTWSRTGLVQESLGVRLPRMRASLSLLRERGRVGGRKRIKGRGFRASQSGKTGRWAIRLAKSKLPRQASGRAGGSAAASAVARTRAVRRGAAAGFTSSPTSRARSPFSRFSTPKPWRSSSTTPTRCWRRSAWSFAAMRRPWRSGGTRAYRRKAR